MNLTDFDIQIKQRQEKEPYLEREFDFQKVKKSCLDQCEKFKIWINEKVLYLLKGLRKHSTEQKPHFENRWQAICRSKVIKFPYVS